MPHKLDIVTAGTALGMTGAGKAMSTYTEATNADFLTNLGIFWLVIQTGFFLYDRWKKWRKPDEE